jgi:hypothetical protein
MRFSWLKLRILQVDLGFFVIFFNWFYFLFSSFKIAFIMNW